MDTLRFILVSALAVVLIMLWQAWEQDYNSQPAQVIAQEEPAIAGEVLPDSGESGIPAVAATTSIDDTAQTGVATPTPTEGSKPPLQSVKVETDLLDLEIDTRGGSIIKLLLRDFPVSLERPEEKFQLFKPESPNQFVAQSGLLGTNKEHAPTHETPFRTEVTNYQMEEGQDELTVDLFWSQGGIHVTKRFIFHRGSYQIEVQHLVQNNSGSGWSGREYRQLLRSPAGKDDTSRFLYTYTGAAIYSPEEKYEKIPFKDMKEDKLSRDVSGGWVGMLQHYFIGAWVPMPGEKNHFYSNVLPGERYQVGAYSPLISVASGSSHKFSSSLVVGPKLQDQLRDIAPGLELTVDYGWLTILAQPIFWLLGKLHALIGNWGWAIIALTILIKLAFFKLSATSYRSMANMRRMTPRMQALKERYGDDKQQLNQAMMDLYKKEKINPLGGCLPIVVQIPVFIALYWVLMEAVELRQAPFIFWLQDLSLKDPYYVLPLIMGVSMFIQQKLNPAPPDPMQAKIMMSLPFVFTVFFAFFPAGLVLYWVTNNILSIAQQWYITRQIEQAAVHH